MREKFVSQNMENFNFVPTLLKTTSQELEQKPFPKKKSWRIFRELGGVIFRSVKHCNCFPSVQARCIIFYQNGVNSLFRLGIKCFFFTLFSIFEEPTCVLYSVQYVLHGFGEVKKVRLFAKTFILFSCYKFREICSSWGPYGVLRFSITFFRILKKKCFEE